MFEQPIPTRYAVAVHEALLELGYDNTLEEPICLVAADTSECIDYYADIWIPNLRVVIEIDGRHHEVEPYRSNDSYRQNCMEDNGISVIRFSNWEVYEDLPKVVDTIPF